MTEFRPGSYRELILAALRAEPEREFTPQELRDIAGCSATNVHKALVRLAPVIEVVRRPPGGQRFVRYLGAESRPQSA